MTRLNRLSTTERLSSCYMMETGSPKSAKDMEAGALQKGGTVNIFSRQHMGLVLQYAAVGLVFGVLPSTVYPFMQTYLNASGAQVMTAMTLILLPWTFKVFFGTLSDCFPICGYRRRPYMVIGWTICVGSLLIMASCKAGQPYFEDPLDRQLSPKDYTPEVEARLNRDAPSNAGRYMALMMMSAFGYTLASVCADGLVVEMAQREPLAERGRTQSKVYTLQILAMTLGKILTGFAFNGVDYGGSFNFSLSFPQLMLVLAVVTAPMIPMSWLFIQESTKPPMAFTKYVNGLWQFIQKRAVFQFLFYAFFSGIFNSFSCTAGTPIQLFIVKVTPINNTISELIGSLLCMGIFALIGEYGLAWNWRVVTVATGMLVVILDAVCTFTTVWDVFRSQWFWLGMPVVADIPNYITYLIGTFVTVELVGEGQEGAIFGLLTTISNLSSPFATTLTRIVDSSWDLSNERVQTDDYSVRRDITVAYVLMYLMTAVSWLFLFLLPKQKRETQELKKSGGSSTLCGGLTVGYLAIALVWSFTTNILAISSSTSCLVIAGGDGC